MKIRRLIIMVVLLLACVGVRGADYSVTYYLASGVPLEGQSLSTVFGDGFEMSYYVEIKDAYTGNSVSGLEALPDITFVVKGNDGNVLTYDDFRKIPVGEYAMVLQYKGVDLEGANSKPGKKFRASKTLTVTKRPIALNLTKTYYGVHNGTLNYSISDFDVNNQDNVSLNDFEGGCSITKVDGVTSSGLASFDNTTVIDFDKTTFVFTDGSASTDVKVCTVNWDSKSNDANSDWSANYECVPRSWTGYISSKCPEIEWKMKSQNGEGTTVSNTVDMPYGKTVGIASVENCKPQYYDLYPVLKDITDCNDATFGANIYNPYVEFSKDGGNNFVEFKTDLIYNENGYVFKASFKNISNQVCESAPITVNITKLTVEAKPQIVKTKFFDGTDEVMTKDDGECTIENTDLRVRYNAKYEDANAGTNKKITITFNELQGTNANSYVLKNSELTYTDGVIKPISPKVKWQYLDNDCKDQTKQALTYGESVKNVTAYLVFDTNEQNENFEKDYKATYLLDGKAIKDNTELDPTKTYTLKVTFEYKGDKPNEGNKNVKVAEGSIKITAAKLAIDLQWSGSDKNKLEFGDAKVTDGLSYNAVNKLAQSQISYVYYLSSNLKISDDDLFTDANKVKDGFAPKIGKYKFGCIATDKKDLMEDGMIAEEIEIKKSSKYFKIDPPEIECKKRYDGNWFAKVVKPAKYGDIEFETKAYYVDGDIDAEVKKLEEKDFRTEASVYYSVFYQFVVPKEVSDTYNLYINSDMDGKGNIIYDAYKSGDFVYYKPGQILCNTPQVEVVVPEKVIYGDCTLGGEGEKDVKAYIKYNDEIISVEGEWSFSDYKHHLGYEAGTSNLSVGTYVLEADFLSHNDNFCDAFSDEFQLSIVPRPLTIVGDLLISDKYEDGTDIIERSAVVVPTVTGVLSMDEGNVSVNWDYSNTKYPSPDVKYADEAETIVAAYENIPVGVSLSGKRAFNYELPSNVIYGKSKILPFTFSYNIEPEDVKTYRLLYGKSVLGVDLKLINELESGQYVRYVVDGMYDNTFVMQPPKENPEDFYYVDVQIVEGDRDVDLQSGEVKVLSRQKIKLFVDKYKLIVSEPIIEHRKIYDGNTSVAWVNVNNCIVTNAVPGDDVALDGEPVMAFDTPDVGEGKKITVSFNMKGSQLYRYIMPDGYVYNDGVIVQLGRIDEIIVQSIAPSILPSYGGYCSGDDIVINVKFTEGLPDKCNLLFADDAKKVGFYDAYNIDMQKVSDGLYTLTYKCPDAVYGRYHAYVQFVDPLDGRTKDSELFEFAVNYSSNYLQSKYKNVGYDGDVLVIKNLDPNYFVEYQWYKTPFEDNEPAELRGETKQFLYETPYLYGKYSATMVTVDGTKVRVCPKWFGPKDKSLSKSSVEKSVSVYPNPASSMEDITIKLIGFDYESCSRTNILIYNSMGSIVMTLDNVDELNTVNLPSGNYSGVVAVDGQTITFKFIVRN